MKMPESRNCRKICSDKRLLGLSIVWNLIFVIVIIPLAVYCSNYKEDVTRIENKLGASEAGYTSLMPRMPECKDAPPDDNDSDPICQFPVPKIGLAIRHSVCLLPWEGDFKLITRPENNKVVNVTRICNETTGARKFRVYLYCNGPPVNTCSDYLCNGNCNEVVFNTTTGHSRIELVYDNSCANLDAYIEIWNPKSLARRKMTRRAVMKDIRF